MNHDVQRKPAEHHASAEASGERNSTPPKKCAVLISCQKSQWGLQLHLNVATLDASDPHRLCRPNRHAAAGANILACAAGLGCGGNACSVVRAANRNSHTVELVSVQQNISQSIEQNEVQK